MVTFIVRRTLWTVLVMFVITVLVFFIFFKTPGIDPARGLAGRNPSPKTLAEIRAMFGLNRPLPVQYGLMMDHLFITRNLVSYSNQGELVVPEIGAATPARAPPMRCSTRRAGSRGSSWKRATAPA